MPPVYVPYSGVVSVSHLNGAFPGVASSNSMASYVGVHPAVSSTPPIGLASFRGLEAVSPTHTATTLYDTGVAGTAKATAILSASALAISTNDGGTLVLSTPLKNYLSNPSHQGAVTYSASTALPTGVTLNSTTGVIAVDPALVSKGSTFARTITATNRWGNTSTLASTFNFAAAAAAAAQTTFLAWIEEVGGNGYESSVNYFFFYANNYPSLKAAMVVGRKIRIANYLGVTGAFSAYMTITAFVFPRPGNSSQAQVTFTPACVLQPYRATTYEITD